MLGARLMASAQTRRRIFTASGTFTVPAGITTLYATACGPGGAGGGGTANGGGGGGGSGAIVYGICTVSPGATVTITMDASVSRVYPAGVSDLDAYAGSTGTSATFGAPPYAGGAGGSHFYGTGWSYVEPQNGSSGFSGLVSVGGNGAFRVLQFGITGTRGMGGGASANGTAATGYGAGGGGGGPIPSGSTTGGAGAPGIVILEW